MAGGRGEFIVARSIMRYGACVRGGGWSSEKHCLMGELLFQLKKNGEG